MKRAEYRIKIKDHNKSEQILDEIDNFFIEMGQKYPCLEVST